MIIWHCFLQWRFLREVHAETCGNVKDTANDWWLAKFLDKITTCTWEEFLNCVAIAWNYFNTLVSNHESWQPVSWRGLGEGREYRQPVWIQKHLKLTQKLEGQVENTTTNLSDQICTCTCHVSSYHTTVWNSFEAIPRTETFLISILIAGPHLQQWREHMCCISCKSWWRNSYDGSL